MEMLPGRDPHAARVRTLDPPGAILPNPLSWPFPHAASKLMGCLIALRIRTKELS